jgi:hypothetical protein
VFLDVAIMIALDTLEVPCLLDESGTVDFFWDSRIISAGRIVSEL